MKIGLISSLVYALYGAVTLVWGHPLPFSSALDVMFWHVIIGFVYMFIQAISPLLNKGTGVAEGALDTFFSFVPGIPIILSFVNGLENSHIYFLVIYILPILYDVTINNWLIQKLQFLRSDVTVSR